MLTHRSYSLRRDGGVPDGWPGGGAGCPCRRLPSSVQAKWDAITKCAPLVDDGARHACLDDVLRKSGLMPDAGASCGESPAVWIAGAGGSGSGGAVPAAASPAVAAASVTPPAAAVAAPSAKHAAGRSDSGHAGRLSNEAADGALVLNTTEGAVWRQIEAADLHPYPVAGDTLTLKRTLFGGYMCQSKKWIVFRCVRTR